VSAERLHQETHVVPTHVPATKYFVMLDLI